VGDYYDILANLDDLKAAANKWIQVQQKWSDTGALTSDHSEKDPSKGLQKA
jgi:hypothetical protein